METEILYWAQTPGVQITLIPLTAKGKSRAIPENIQLDLALASRSAISKMLAALESLFSVYLFYELVWLVRSGKLSPKSIFISWRSLSTIKSIYRVLMKNVSAAGPNGIHCYTYWFDNTGYAASLLKRPGAINTLVARAHGSDVYEERRPDMYMPFKRQFSNFFDRIFAISLQGKTYLQTRYNIPENKIELFRLGVNISDKTSVPTSANVLHIVSISFCAPVKRIDRIIDALALLSNILASDKSIVWTHIGGGKLLSELERYAQERLGSLNNISYNLLGHRTNSDVLDYLGKTDIDVLLNTSESEGIPVSMMEAMSFGIPVIGPWVGGIPEIVDESCGILLSSSPSPNEIAQALLPIEQFKKSQIRESAKEKIRLHYDASRNYPAFISSLMSHIKTHTDSSSV